MSLRVEKLTRQHVLDDFDCGHEALNRFLLRFAWPNQQASASQTYVGLDDNAVIGFYTLVVGEVAYDGAPERLTKGLARHPVPIMLLARMGVRVGLQGRGIGAGLVKDAMLRTIAAADIAGTRPVAGRRVGRRSRGHKVAQERKTRGARPELTPRLH